MTTITSQVHSEAVSDWSPIGPLVSGMGSSLAFTILTGLAERLAWSLPSAFRTCYVPRCLSAQGKSRDLQHLSPMLTRCGNSALRDMAHMGICPVQSDIPHDRRSFLQAIPGGNRVLIYRALEAHPSNRRLAQEHCRGRAIFSCRSSRVEKAVFLRQWP
jgi:hypothetical protein